MQDQLFDMLLKENEITWQDIIYDLIKSEQMDPWDIDISLLTKKYIDTIKQLKEANFFISGKMLLAASLLLKIKTNKLLTEDIANLDNILFPKEEYEELQEEIFDRSTVEIPQLAIKTPQTRKRKVSVNDLINSLQKALKVSNRKTMKRIREKEFNTPGIPEKKIDITKLIKDIYEKILNFLKVKEKITFSEITNSEKREDKILTLIPLLHLDTQEKISIDQKEHFGEIEILRFKRL